MWTADLRHPTLLVGLTMDRERLAERIDRRVDEMIGAGAAEEARAALEAGPSRTARAALGFEQLVADIDAAPSAEAIESIKAAHRAYARRQLTWMRRMEGVELIDRTDRDDGDVAAQITERLGPE
jgi:tRNA dimethylallyltransferase